MRNLLAFLAAALLTVAGLGWYFEWYKVERTPAGPGRHSFNIDIDSKKISEDVKKGVQHAEKNIQNWSESNGTDKPAGVAEPKKNEPVAAVPSSRTEPTKPQDPNRSGLFIPLSTPQISIQPVDPQTGKTEPGISISVPTPRFLIPKEDNTRATPPTNPQP